jgi:ELWxxDGT repeat protein
MLAVVNGTLFFRATDGVNGRELWKSDGTADGTVLVRDINPGSASADIGIGGGLNVDGKLFFAADDGFHGRELWALVPPQVESVVLNDGSAQRSIVRSITVTFSEILTIDAGAFELRQQGGGLVGLEVRTALVDGKTVAMLTFTGNDIIGGSLADGSYTLFMRADHIHDRWGWELDANGDGRAGGDRLDAFFRLFGDSDGDRDVDLRDLARFLSSLGRRPGDPLYLAYFDVNGDDWVGVVDLIAFARRFGTHLNP